MKQNYFEFKCIFDKIYKQTIHKDKISILLKITLFIARV
jgi:hypothetical protein